MQLHGKQLTNNTVNQEKLKISSDSITDKTSVTNTDFIYTDSVDKVSRVDYSALNLNMTANNATIGQKACDTHVIEFPIGAMQVKVNNVSVSVGENSDCFFSPDGVTIRDGGFGEKGDYLYWSSDGYDLDDTDEIDFIYLKGTDVIELDAGSTLELDPFYNTLNVKYIGTDGTTMTLTIDGVNFTVGNVAGNFVWDIGGSNETTFTIPNDSIVQDVNGIDYIIWFDGIGSLLYSIKQQNQLIIDGFGFITNKLGSFTPSITTSDGSVATWEVSGEQTIESNSPSYILDGSPKVVKMTIDDFNKIESFTSNNCAIEGIINFDEYGFSGLINLNANNNGSLTEVILPSAATLLRDIELNYTSVKSLNLDNINSNAFDISHACYVGLSNVNMDVTEIENLLNNAITNINNKSWTYIQFDLFGNERPTDINLINVDIYKIMATNNISFLIEMLSSEILITFDFTVFNYTVNSWYKNSNHLIEPTWKILETGDTYTGYSPNFQSLPVGDKTIRITNFYLLSDVYYLLQRSIGVADLQGIMTKNYDLNISNNLTLTNIVNIYGHIDDLNIYNTTNITSLDMSTFILEGSFNFANSALESFSGITSYDDSESPLYIRGENSALTGDIDMNGAYVENVSLNNTNITSLTNFNSYDIRPLNLTLYTTQIGGVFDLTGNMIRTVYINDTNITDILVDTFATGATAAHLAVYNTQITGDRLGQLLEIYNTAYGNTIFIGTQTIQMYKQSDYIPLSYEPIVDNLISNGWDVFYNSSIEVEFQTNKNGTFTPTITNDLNYKYMWSVSGEVDQEVYNPSFILDGTTRTVKLKNAAFAKSLNISTENILDNPDLRNFGSRQLTTPAVITASSNIDIITLQLPIIMSSLSLSNCSIDDTLDLSTITITSLTLIGNVGVTQFKEFIASPDGVLALHYSNTSVSGIIDLQNYPYDNPYSTWSGYINFDNTNITDVINLHGTQAIRHIRFQNTNITGVVDLSNVGSVRNLYFDGSQISGLDITLGSSDNALTFLNCNMSDSEMGVLLETIVDKFTPYSSTLNIKGNEITSNNTLLQLSKLYESGWIITIDPIDAVFITVSQNGSFTPSVGTKDGSITTWLVDGYGEQVTNEPNYTLDGNDHIVIINNAAQINDLYFSGITYGGSNKEYMNDFRNITFSGGTIDVSYTTSSNSYSYSYIRNFNGSVTSFDASNMEKTIFYQGSGNVLQVEGTWNLDNYQRTNPNIQIDSLTGMDIYARNTSMTTFNSASYSFTFIKDVVDLSGTTTLTSISPYYRSEVGNFISLIAPNNTSLNRDLVYSNLDVELVNFENCSINNIKFRNYADNAVVNLRNNSMVSSNVDYLLNDINNKTSINGTVHLDGNNAAPSATGLVYKSELEAKGWTVNVTV